MKRVATYKKRRVPVALPGEVKYRPPMANLKTECWRLLPARQRTVKKLQ